jgi:Ca2+-binding RTX toxin-like protein
MADFASIPGGSGEHLTFDAVSKGIDAFYHIDTSHLVFLTDRIGDSVVDATGQDSGLLLALGKGDDKAVTGDGNDEVSGGNGADVISTGSGDDTVSGGNGADTVTLGDGDDVAFGGVGADSLYGQAGDDTLAGDVGNDSIAGGAGDDLLLGGVGADTLSGGEGDDVLAGGTGGDVFVFGNDFGRDTMTDFGPGDTLQFTANLNGSGIQVPGDLVQFVSGGAGVTKITIGESTITLQGTDKDDFLAHLSAKVQII